MPRCASSLSQLLGLQLGATVIILSSDSGGQLWVFEGWERQGCVHAGDGDEAVKADKSR